MHIYADNSHVIFTRSLRAAARTIKSAVWRKNAQLQLVYTRESAATAMLIADPLPVITARIIFRLFTSRRSHPAVRMKIATLSLDTLSSRFPR